MSDHDQVAARAVRHVLRRAVADATYRTMLLQKPNAVMRFELARFGAPVPEIEFDAVEQTAKSLVVRVPIAESERRAQSALQPIFQFVDSANESELAAFVRAPKKRIEALLGIVFEDDIEVSVRIEAQGQRVLVIPQDEFGAISADASSPAEVNPKIKLCPAGVTIDLCPKGVTVDLCPSNVTVDVCPADCTFTVSCGCTISCTVSTDFPTILHAGSSADAAPQDAIKKLSNLLDE